MKWLIYGLLAFLLYLIFQHHPTLVIYCVLAYLFWKYVIEPSKMTTEKQLLILAKAEDMKMGKLLRIMENVATQLEKIATAQSESEDEEVPEYARVEEYDHIKSTE